MTVTAHMKVDRLEDDEGRVLIYGWPTDDAYGVSYHVIATPAAAAGIKPGDVIEYEPYGINFGWLVGPAGAKHGN
jgi:hypothetical protein